MHATGTEGIMGRHELWVELADRPGNLAALAGDLASCGANIIHLEVLAGSGERGHTVTDRLVIHVPDHRNGDLAAVALRYGAAQHRRGVPCTPATEPARPESDLRRSSSAPTR